MSTRGPVRTEQPGNATQRSPFGHLPPAAPAAVAPQQRTTQQSAPRQQQAPVATAAATPRFTAEEVAEFRPLLEKFAKMQISMPQILTGFGGSMEKLNRFKDYLRANMQKMSKEESNFYYPIFYRYRTGQITVQTAALECGKDHFPRFKELIPQMEEAFELWHHAQNIQKLEKEQQELQAKARLHGQRADEYGRQAAEHGQRAAEHAKQAQAAGAQRQQHEANFAALTMYRDELVRQNQQAEKAIADSRQATIDALRSGKATHR